MEDALEDINTYITVKKDPSISIEKKLNKMIKKWYGKDYITKKEMLQLRANDSLLPKVYLPKIHKENIPLRIIVSSVNTTLYLLAKFLNKVNSIIFLVEFQVKNSPKSLFSQSKEWLYFIICSMI